MMSATMPTSFNFTCAAAGKEMPGTPEKATASAVPRKWSSRSGKGHGRDGVAVCAEVCRPSCRWAKARRQKIGNGERVSRRKKGKGAEERRQLRRQLRLSEARVEELEAVRGKLEAELKEAAGAVRECERRWAESRAESEEERRQQQSREMEAEEREQWLEKEAGWRAELRWKERVLVAVERKRGREVAELREELEEAQRDGRERVERCSGDG